MAKRKTASLCATIRNRRPNYDAFRTTISPFAPVLLMLRMLCVHGSKSFSNKKIPDKGRRAIYRINNGIFDMYLSIRRFVEYSKCTIVEMDMPLVTLSTHAHAPAI